MRTEPGPIDEPAAAPKEKIDEAVQTVDAAVENKFEDKPEEPPVIVIGEAFRT